MGRPRRAFSLVELAILNFVVALAIALVIKFKFLVWSVDKSSPPHCFTHGGHEISCRLEGSTNAIFYAALVGVFVLLAGIELLVRLSRSPETVEQ